MYGTNEDLPEAVRSTLTPEAQAIFLSAYNDVLAEGNGPQGGGTWALSRAWMAVGRQYQLTEGGYESVTGAAMFQGEAVEHEIQIQVLDREVIAGGRPVKLPKERFEKTLGEWDGRPLIFAQKHPKPKLYDKDPEAELKRIGGRVVGAHKGAASIDMTGHPRLMGMLATDGDEEVEKGIADGKISTSNGYYNCIKGGEIDGDAHPHHILLFYEKPGSEPGDQGAFILTQRGEEDEITLIDRLKARVMGRRPVHNGPEEVHDNNEEENMADNKELEAQLAGARKEAADAKLASLQLQSEKAKLEDDLKAKDAEIKRLGDENAAFLQRGKNEKWIAFKTEHIPPGLLAGEGKELALRTELEADAIAFLAAHKGQLVGFGPDGDEGDGNDGADPVQFVAESGEPKKRERGTTIGVKSPLTGKYGGE